MAKFNFKLKNHFSSIQDVEQISCHLYVVHEACTCLRKPINLIWSFSLSSVGKSTLLTMLTGTHSEAASYEFTTLTCIPGIIHYNDTKIQLLDLPGIIEGASEGKGRGRQVMILPKHFLKHALFTVILKLRHRHGSFDLMFILSSSFTVIETL